MAEAGGNGYYTFCVEPRDLAAFSVHLRRRVGVLDVLATGLPIFAAAAGNAAAVLVGTRPAALSLK